MDVIFWPSQSRVNAVNVAVKQHGPVTEPLVDLTTAEAGRVGEAIELVQRTHFDIAILDVNLHGEPVFPVAEAIKARHRPFIFATGYNASILPDEFRNHPALQKPFRIEALRELIEITVKRQR